MKSKHPLYLAVVVLAFLTISLTSLISPATVSAELDPGMKEIFQNGELVGTILVPYRAPEVCIYMEYWYLFDTYVYPGQDNPVRTIIEHTEGEVTSLEEFEAKMENAYPGGYMVHVESVEMRPDCR